ncbi:MULTISPECIES: NADH-quinone oxidoreductase subunit NuoH [Thermoactinomyces]|jgi:NADH-quinone oxidoreductase subunit H|uniref:NADH-quinone oxidoreductase subunit H n=1 Tax=Thermoactinomyces daqus TaxID=1329516 RepID=A0A7W2AHK7_9BACL|nr:MULTISPECIES: NADH-quinone oxidoreductase subunit NuoH [Thermoactinomyces]MBA4541829.1 NADH-quinone oxidoreductase subunit NuoH [Thermoactinomyces daqus]MBH8597826.1 NADH-quinone oxidoreductase subunit NuoH [Thermoactinomyces sp. CICC 10523]MBH8604177.1 NADH-quinone oxidoreductase subunit NuoH [Thermoactinomyces sp. CICC 10522]MBH8608101.1 NADH-quinone oxidoreductase subunit NuoH [Thermoactinomyces sp. CICC 10521]
MSLLAILAPVLLLVIVLAFVTYAILFERKVIGWMQNRIGPNRVGPWGMLQTVADVFKLLIKEDVIPEKADRALFKLAPAIAFVPAFAVLAVIPFTETWKFTDFAVGLLYYMAVSSITIIGIMVGGWASNNKYALLGGMRSAAQMISYEIPLVMSVVGIIMTTGSLNLNDIVHSQKHVWFIFPQIIGFLVFLIAAVSELNRTPFDLPEAESELVAGYHVEYTGFRFAFFMLAEYVYVFAMASLTTVLYLGGWNAPFGLTIIPPIIWFILKFLLVVFFLFWLRATMPRIRVDQLMQFAWKVLLPLAIFNIFLTAVLKEVPGIGHFY